MDDGRTSMVGRARTQSAQWRRQRRSMSVAAALFLVVGLVGVGTLQVGGAPEETLIAESGDDATTSTTDTTSTTTEPPVSSTSTTIPSVAEPEPEPAPAPESGPEPAPAPVVGPEAEQPVRFEITARIEMLEATSTPPFTVDTTDPGAVIAAEGGRHEVGFTGTDGTVYVNDPQFAGDMRENGGRLRTSSCAPNPEDGCASSYGAYRVDEASRQPRTVLMYTTELAPGTYVLDQPIAWARELFKEMGDDPDGRALLRITYEVRAFAGGAG